MFGAKMSCMRQGTIEIIYARISQTETPTNFVMENGKFYKWERLGADDRVNTVQSEDGFPILAGVYLVVVCPETPDEFVYGYEYTREKAEALKPEVIKLYQRKVTVQ